MNANLIKRAVTGTFFVAVLVGCILGGAVSHTVLFTVASALSVYEFGQLVNRHAPGARVDKALIVVGGVCLYLGFTAFCTNLAGPQAFVPYLVLLLYLLIRELYQKKENPVLCWAYSLMSQLYVALPFALLNVLAFHNLDASSSGVAYNPVLPLSIFIFLWLNDTGAYCVGSLLGKHRLFERISPKKSWEGSIGGGLLTLAGSLVLARYFFFLSVWQWLGLALVVVVFGTWGDLTESLLKRQLHIKDSGNILPGHGGMLDRFDSALMAIPAAVVYLSLLSL